MIYLSLTYLGYGIFGLWHVWAMACLDCGMPRLWHTWAMAYLIANFLKWAVFKGASPQW